MIKIVTDSTAGLPEAMIQAHDIRVVPLCVHFGEQAFKEKVDLSTEEFYDRLSKATQLPTTSQPSAGEFYEVFKELVDAGHEVVALTISSKLSGTWSSAMAALEMLPGAPITVVDSLVTSVGMYLMLERATEAVAAGARRHEVEELLCELRDKVYVSFVVDTLEYLQKGGRIGNAKAFLGTLLKIKPILVLQDGLIEPLEQVRSKRKALTRMIDLAEERLNGKGAQATVHVCHAVCPEEAVLLKDEVMARLGCAEPAISEVGAVLGSHTGPGVIGMAVCV
jgi:DegV family protein with EDD domain